MAAKDIITRTLDAGRGVGQRSQDRIEGIVSQLQRMSEDQLDQVVALVGELRDRSVLSGEQVASAVDRRVREQLSSLGLATKSDVVRLEAKVDALTGGSSSKAPVKNKVSGKSPSKEASAAKAARSRSATKKSGATKKAGATKKSGATKKAGARNPGSKTSSTAGTRSAGSRPAG